MLSESYRQRFSGLARVYGEAAYRTAFSLLIAFLGLGIIAGLFTRETACQPYRE